MSYHLVLVGVVVGVIGCIDITVSVRVNLKQGVFKGEILDAGDERTIYSFRGIPYAKPPVGDLRFKDPVSLEYWHGIRESFTPSICPQVSLEGMMKGELVTDGEEDCLYLHVYTPKLCGGTLFPVMVFLHGGGFIAGNPDIIGGTPLPLLKKDVVLVSLQYRLGTLGFLSTGDSILPGNLGLKDQTLALQWVKDNIQSFGGNPDSVTIFGESAGGASVHLQMLTPKAEGLFHRAILQSGSGLAPWAIRSDHRDVALELARHLECSGVDSKEGKIYDTRAFLSCLQTAPIKDLLMAFTYKESWNNIPFYMVPRIDGDYLPDHPVKLMQQGRHHKVDVISGVCQHEGAFSAIGAVTTPSGEKLIKYFSKLAPLSVGVDEDDNSLYVARRIYYHYLGGGNITINESNVDELVQMYGDTLFTVAQDVTAQLMARDSVYGKNVYVYQLEQSSNVNPMKRLNTSLEMKWVNHADDLLFLFSGVFGSGPLEQPDDILLSDIMVDLWTTFAATGNPTPDYRLGFKWLPVTSSSLHHLSLKAVPTMQPDSRAEIRSFILDLPTKQNMLLFPEKFITTLYDDVDGDAEYCHI